MHELFMEYMVPVLGTALSLVLGSALSMLVAFLNKKKKEIDKTIENEMVKEFIDKINQTITDCVIATNQTYVESLKKENAFTKEAQQEAFKLTLNNIITIIGEDSLELLKYVTSDVNVYLKNKIEAEIKKNKGDK